MKLQQHVLLIIALPLAFQMVFVGSLAYLLNQAEREALEQKRAKDIMFDAHRLIELFYNCGAALVTYKFSGADFSEEQFERAKQKITKQLELLKSRTPDGNEENQALQKVIETAEYGLHLCETEHHHIIELGVRPTQGNARLAAKLQDAYSQMMLSLHELTEVESAKGAGEQLFNSSRSLLSIALPIGLAVNVMIAVALAITCSTSTARRLHLLMQNIKHFQSKEALAPPLSGADEIAELDNVFHDMALTAEEADKKREQYEQLRKQFLAMITHDLRAPLMVIQSSMDMLSCGIHGSLSEKAERDVAVSKMSSHQMMRLVNDLLELERLEETGFNLSLEKCDLAELAEECVKQLRPLAEIKNINIQLSTEPCLAVFDRARIEQIMCNLLSNAIKFSEQSSRIEIHSGIENGAPTIHVRDFGRGIPEEFRSRIFTRFAQAKKSDSEQLGGYGLGLSICQAIIDAHGGKIGFTEGLERGTELWFSLPPFEASENLAVVEHVS